MIAIAGSCAVVASTAISAAAVHICPLASHTRLVITAPSPSAILSRLITVNYWIRAIIHFDIRQSDIEHAVDKVIDDYFMPRIRFRNR